MASRPIATKQADGIRRELNRSTPQSFIDVYKWMKMRRYARTRQEAADLVLAGCLRNSEGEPIGILGEDDDKYAAKFIKTQEAEGMYLDIGGNEELASA